MATMFYAFIGFFFLFAGSELLVLFSHKPLFIGIVG